VKAIGLVKTASKLR